MTGCSEPNSMAKRILVLSASVGAGHMRAAQAVELALKQTAPDAVVRNVDILTLTNTLFRRLYGSAYLDLVNKAPHVLGYMYDLLDRPRKPGSRRDKLRLPVEKMKPPPIFELLPDPPRGGVGFEHVFPAQILARP